MDKNTWIGFLLIAAIIVGFTMLTRPSKEEIAARQRINDSIAVARRQRINDSIAVARQMEFEAQQISAALAAENEQAAGNQPSTVSSEQLNAVYGPFAPSAQGESQEVVLENEKIRLFIDTKGGHRS